MANTHSTWIELTELAKKQSAQEPLLNDFYQQTLLKHTNFSDSIAFLLAGKLSSSALSAEVLQQQFSHFYQNKPQALLFLCKDLEAFSQRDSACINILHAYCFYKGFHALSAYRAMHHFWRKNKTSLALQLQQRSASVFDVDIHPAANIGSGIMLDHATGIVIGETAVIGNNVSIMQGVTLGGTGKEGGDRHPKIRDGVLISVGAAILGNITIGEGAQVSAGSVVLKDVPAHTCVAGVPAKHMGKTHVEHPAQAMNHKI